MVDEEVDMQFEVKIRSDSTGFRQTHKVTVDDPELPCSVGRILRDVDIWATGTALEFVYLEGLASGSKYVYPENFDRPEITGSCEVEVVFA